MGRTWTQFKLQLKKIMWYRRRRKPAVMLLEVIWPVALFAIVIAVRQGSLPERKAQCFYKPRAMPSAGALEFLQSHICNVNNRCLRKEQYVNKGKPHGSTGGAGNGNAPLPPQPLVMSLSLGTDEGTEQILPLVPKVLKLLDNLQETISKPQVEEYFSGNGLKIKHLIKDHAVVKEFLVEEDFVPPGLVDEFFESEVGGAKPDPKSGGGGGGESQGGAGFVDIKQTLCDPVRFANIINIPPDQPGNAERISAELCRTNHTKLSELAELLTQELKTASLTDTLTGGLESLQSYTATDGVTDLVKIINATTSLQMFAALRRELPIFGHIGAVMTNIQDIVLNAHNKNFLDVMKLVAPLIGNLVNDEGFTRDTIAFSTKLFNIVKFFEKATAGSSFNLVDILETSAPLQAAIASRGGDVAQYQRALSAQIVPSKVRSLSDMLRLGMMDFHAITCEGSVTLTSIFASPGLDYLKDFICGLEEDVVNSVFQPLLNYPRMVQIMDNIQRQRTIGVFDVISVFSEGYLAVQNGINLGTRTANIINSFSDSTSTLGKRVQDALNIKFTTKSGVDFGATRILDIISYQISKTEELKSLASGIHLAGQIVRTAEHEFTEVRSVLSDPPALAAVLLTNGISDRVVDELLGSAVNLTMILNAAGAQGQLASTLCSGSQVLTAFGLSDQAGIEPDLLESILCGANIVDQIDLKEVLSRKLAELIPNYMMYGGWWEETINDVNGVMDGVSAIMEVASGQRIFDVRVLLKVLYHFVDSVGVGGRADISNKIPSVLQLIRDTFVSPSYFEDDLFTLSQGILSMSIFTRTIPIVANIEKSTKHPMLVFEFLTKEAELSTEVSTALLASDLRTELSYNIRDLSFNGKEEPCGPSLIDQFFNIRNASQSDRNEFARILCNLDPAKMRKLMKTLVPHLNMKDLVRNMLDLSPSHLLASSNLTQEETRQFVNQVGPLGAQFSSLISSVRDVVGTNDTFKSTQSALSSYGEKFCGDPFAFSFGNYGASFLSADKADENKADREAERTVPKEREWTPSQLEEIAMFNDPTCVELYKSINSLAGIGPILWSFIKPLTRGKVLYSPNNLATQTIMKEAYWLFAGVEQVEELARTWISFAEKKTSGSSGSTEDVAGLHKLMKVLNNPMVSGAVLQATGVSGSKLSSSLGGGHQITQADIDQITSLARELLRFARCFAYGLEGFDSSEEMEIKAQNLSSTSNLLAGVEFLNMEERTKRSTDPAKLVLPKHVEYVLRLTIDHVQIPASLFDGVREAGPSDDFLDDLRYLWGFVVMQDLVDNAIIKLQTGLRNATAQLTKTLTQSFPYPCYDQDDFMVWSSFVVVIILLFSWLCMMAVGITSAVSEKESGIEDTMMVMGMKGSVNRLAWFTNTLLGMIFLSAFVTALIRGGSLVPRSDPILIFLWLSTYSISIVMLCYLVSALVHRTTLASLFGLLVYLMLCIPFIILHSMGLVFHLNFKQKVLMSLSVTSAFCFGANELIVTEKNGQGITWDTAFIPSGETYPFAWSCIMSVVDCIIYFLIAWYISNKFPGAHGIPQPWYFPFSPYFWGCKKLESVTYDLKTIRSMAGTSQRDDVVPDMMSWLKGHGLRGTLTKRHLVPGEEEPQDLPVGISMCGLTKIYNAGMRSWVGKAYHRLTGKKKLKAVDNLSVNFFEGQITAFLGHNGAGKSTCIHMLTGLIPPTDGTAFIGGYSIKDGFQEIRKTMGFCPQNDVLFDYMTIKEHFLFYARLKQHGTALDPNEETEKMLDLTGLRPFKNVAVNKLSGGQRRRVSVGNAFIGGSKVIILDEPTSGVDPAARRLIWDIIAKHKEGRTILLCTHHLDEADILGDRIVIVHQGRLICSGTSLWLKTHYGSGYHLTVSKLLSENRDSQDTLTPSGHEPTGTWSTRRLMRAIRDFVPGAYITEEIGTEVTIVLPTKKQNTRFQELFPHLEAKAEYLCVDKYGIADSTLEEVFLKLTRLAEEGKSLEPKHVQQSTNRKHRGRSYPQYDNDAYDSTEDDNSSIEQYEGDESEMTGKRRSVSTDGFSTPELPRRDYDNYSSFSGSSGRISMQDVELMTAVDGKLGGGERSMGMSLKWRQFKALLLKRFHHHRRDLRSHVSQIVLPALFVCLAMVATWFSPNVGRLTPFRLDATMYGPDQSLLFSVYNSSPLAEKMVESLTKKPGVGTICLPATIINKGQNSWIAKDCSDGETTFVTEQLPADKLAIYQRYPNCSCATGTWQCPAEAVGPPLPTLRTNSGDKLVNLTGYPKGIEQYLLRTFDALKNSERGHRFGGWTFDNDGPRTQATVWYNSKGLHSLPSFYNALNNMALRANIEMANGSADDYGITVHNQPYNKSAWPVTSNGLLMSFSDTGVSLTIMIAYCFVPASFIIYVINERIRQEKRLQFITGVGIALYWFSALLWDMITYSITVAITIGIAKAFHLRVYTHGENLQALATMLMLFGWATTPLMYLLSRWFTNPTVGYVAAFIINLCIGINTTASMFFLLTPIFNSRPEIVLARRILTKGLLIFPQFCLGDSLVKLAYNQIITDITGIFNEDTYTSPFSPGLLFYHFLTLGIEGFVFFVIHLMVEINMCDSTRKVNRSPNYKEDSDVSLERQRVVNGEADQDLLILYNMSKVYSRTGVAKTLAVDNLCLGVPRAECFGLLGVNGAGKTTSFKMITGEIQPSDGAALLKGQVISEDMSSFNQNVGYCPQFDALDDFLTGEEMVYYYSRLRGIMEEDIPGVCSNVVRKFQLERHIKKRVGAYSAGNKRKLSTALALVGDPDLVLLDEPTTGMDPGTRRLVWNNIIEVIKDKRSVILTSHSMEECDALCTRMAIMVNGTFQCMGSSQHLKNKFGSGYTISVTVGGPSSNCNKVIKFMHSKFRGARLKDRHLNMLEFGITSRKCTLAALFQRLEKDKSKLKIENYSVTQTTLDHVFLHFARKQSDNIEHDNDRTEYRENYIEKGSYSEADGTLEPSMGSSATISDMPPSYHSRSKGRSIAPNSYDNRHLTRTLDNVSQIHEGSVISGSDVAGTSSSSALESPEYGDDEFDTSVLEFTGAESVCSMSSSR